MVSCEAGRSQLHLENRQFHHAPLMFAGRYYYAFAYVAGPEGGLNGILGRMSRHRAKKLLPVNHDAIEPRTLSPPVEIFVPTVA